MRNAVTTMTLERKSSQTRKNATGSSDKVTAPQKTLPRVADPVTDALVDVICLELVAMCGAIHRWAHRG